MHSTYIEAGRNALARTRIVNAEVSGLSEGEALIAVERVALTANNITYGAFGDAMRYWNFFPADEGWGRIPLWGFGRVVESRASGLAAGARVYGYFPMGSHLRVRPERINAAGFNDGAAHRAGLPPVYNRYEFAPERSAAEENLEALLRPLFTTSFLIDDYLEDEGFFGAAQVLLASASSKTALGTAFLLMARGGVRVVGLTSKANTGFVSRSGAYDAAIAYDALDTLDRSKPSVLVDMAGNAAMRGAVHAALGSALKASIMVGATHWDQAGGPPPAEGPKPILFFAPDRVVKRNADWTPQGFQTRYLAAWQKATGAFKPLMRVVEHKGAASIEAAYQTILKGAAGPEEGHILLF